MSNHPPLPAWEQIRKPKPIPTWYWNLETLGDKPAASHPADGDNSTIEQAILTCLGTEGYSTCREIVNRTGGREHRVVQQLYRLLEAGKVTFLVTPKKQRLWRRLRPGETVEVS